MGEVVIEKTGEAFTVEDGKYTYEEIKLSGVEFSIYADEDHHYSRRCYSLQKR